MLLDVQAWWRALRPRCAGYDHSGNQHAPPSYRARLTAFTVDDLQRSLRELVAPHLDDAAARVVLPPALRGYLEALFDPVTPVMWSLDQAVPRLLLWDPGAISRQAAADLRSPELRSVADAGVWIRIGEQDRDPRSRLLCCDPTRGEYGLTATCRDAHPWWDGTGCLEALEPFESWLASLLATPLTGRDSLLIALGPRGREELAAARASVDPGALTHWLRTRRDAQMPAEPWCSTKMRSDPSVDALVVRGEALAAWTGEALAAAAGIAATYFAPPATAAVLGGWEDAPLHLGVGAVSQWAGREGFHVEVDPSAAVAAFVRRAVAAGDGLLWVRDHGLDP